MNVKQCKICEKLLPITDFYIYKGYVQSYCKPCHKKKSKRYREENKAKCRKRERRYHKKTYKKYKKTINGYSRRYAKRLREAALHHYSKGKMNCSICGCDIIDVLSIDHIDGNGIKHRKELNAGGAAIYRWLRKNNYPKGFRVLCRNCNWLEHLKKLREKDKE